MKNWDEAAQPILEWARDETGAHWAIERPLGWDEYHIVAYYAVPEGEMVYVRKVFSGQQLVRLAADPVAFVRALQITVEAMIHELDQPLTA